MKTKDRLIMAFRNLWRRKSRTILTILSVVIGTVSIIMMLSLGLGMKEQQMKMIESFGGIDTIDIVSDNSSQAKIDQSTVKKIKEIKNVKIVIPRKDFYAEIKIKGKDKLSVQTHEGIRLVPDEIFKALKQEDFEQGQNLSVADKNGIILSSKAQITKKVKVPGQEWMNEEEIENYKLSDQKYFIRLGYEEESGPKFGSEIEQTSKKPNKVDIPVKIKGKLKSNSFLRGSRGYINESTYKTLQKEDKKLESSQLNQNFNMRSNRTNKKNNYIYDGLSIICKDYESVKEVEEEIKNMGYQTQSNTEMIDNINQTTQRLMTILGGIGSIAFIVSAIGIINTMLMSIYERQKEIGVMKVIGASISDIRSMFLLESGFIGFFGGILGLIISLILSKILNTLFLNSQGLDMMAGPSQYSFSIPIWLAIVGVTFSALVGVLAGYIPAKRATKLSAIETLRSN